tara:strand:- start:142 stop:1026 length:885 start_codon:yes stop_codon:yes gene_type:complete
MINIVCYGEVLWDIYSDKKIIGGAPFNVFSRLHKLGNNVDFISSIGNDLLGKEILEHFNQNNYSHKFLNIDEKYETGSVIINLKNGEPSYKILSNVAWDFIPLKTSYDEILSDLDILIYGSLASRNIGSFKTLKELTKQSKFNILDLNIRESYYDFEKVSFLVSSADFLKVNLEELELINQLFKFNISDTQNLIFKILKQFDLEYVCVTNGEIESMIYDGKNFEIAKSFEVDSIDNVGAGDNFLAALIDELFIKKNNLKSSLRIASAYGAITTTKNGAVPKINNYEVDSMLNSQ